MTALQFNALLIRMIVDKFTPTGISTFSSLTICGWWSSIRFASSLWLIPRKVRISLSDFIVVVNLFFTIFNGFR